MGLGSLLYGLLTRRIVLLLLIVVGALTLSSSTSRNTLNYNAPDVLESGWSKIQNLAHPNKGMVLDGEEEGMARHPVPRPPPAAYNDSADDADEADELEESEDPKPPKDFYNKELEGDYRSHLEETTSPTHFRQSPTLSFDHIYVVSLAKRVDRRTQMSKLAKALRIELTFVDALDSKADEGVVGWIGERVSEVRKKKVEMLVRARRGTAATIGGGGIGSVWLDGTSDRSIPWPPLNNDPRWGDHRDWVQYLRDSNHDNLKPSPDFNLRQALYDPLEKNEHRQITEGVIATWFSHVKALQLMAENQDESALILEDDVDMEWDLRRMWATAHRRLPADWDVVYLGTCWGSELTKPAYLHPILHQSTQPRCLHAYAVSKPGYQKLLGALSSPWLAYQGAVDAAVPALVGRKAINSFSLEPSLVIQAKEFSSDIQPGLGSVWRGVLADSTIERIRKDEGLEVAVPVFDPDQIDPATVYRGGRPIELETDSEDKEKFRHPVMEPPPEKAAAAEKEVKKPAAMPKMQPPPAVKGEEVEVSEPEEDKLEDGDEEDEEEDFLDDENEEDLLDEELKEEEVSVPEPVVEEPEDLEGKDSPFAMKEEDLGDAPWNVDGASEDGEPEDSPFFKPNRPKINLDAPVAKEPKVLASDDHPEDAPLAQEPDSDNIKPFHRKPPTKKIKPKPAPPPKPKAPATPKKVGTGRKIKGGMANGKVGFTQDNGGARQAHAPAHAKEAGKRVGTGARPGAQGMKKPGPIRDVNEKER